jgi:hypothetical protein
MKSTVRTANSTSALSRCRLYCSIQGRMYNKFIASRDYKKDLGPPRKVGQSTQSLQHAWEICFGLWCSILGAKHPSSLRISIISIPPIATTKGAIVVDLKYIAPFPLSALFWLLNPLCQESVKSNLFHSRTLLIGRQQLALSR